MGLLAYNQGGTRIKVHRTGDATWVVTYNGTQLSGPTLSSSEEAERLAFGLVSNAVVTGRGLATKAAAAEVQVITLTSWDGTDAFSIQDQKTGQETIPFVNATNGTAADLQAALRTLTGDASLTVAGTTDTGPFTVTWVAQTTRQAPLAVVRGTGGATGVTTVTTKGGVG